MIGALPFSLWDSDRAKRYGLSDENIKLPFSLWDSVIIAKFAMTARCAVAVLLMRFFWARKGRERGWAPTLVAVLLMRFHSGQAHADNFISVLPFSLWDSAICVECAMVDLANDTLPFSLWDSQDRHGRRILRDRYRIAVLLMRFEVGIDLNGMLRFRFIAVLLMRFLRVPDCDDCSYCLVCDNCHCRSPYEIPIIRVLRRKIRVSWNCRSPYEILR